MRLRLKQQRLMELIAASSLSQNHWALKLGLNKGHWSEIVNGKHPYPSAKTRARMAEVFGVPVDELFEIEAGGAPWADTDFRRAIADRYLIDSDIGQGGMGAVYLARDVRHNRPVAVKVISPEAVSGIGLDQFRREIATIAHLQHPNILPFYDSGDAAGHPFYVMPWVRGGSLRQRLDERVRLPLAEVVDLTKEIAAALARAHEREVLHCDIKPENILLDDGHPYVMDFGIARTLHTEAFEWPRRGELDESAGTPAYVSPEQAAGERNLDGRSDVFSLACVVFEMLTGRPPFEGTTTQAIVASRFVTPPPAIRDYAPDVPLAVQEVVERGMAIKRDDRHAGPRDFAADLASTAATASTAVTAAALGITRMVGRLRRLLGHRPAFGFRLFPDLGRMIRQGTRGLARAPAFSLSVILLLGLGIGSVSAIFAVVDHVLVRPLPYPDVDRLVVIGNGPHSLPAVRDMEAMPSIEAWAAAWTDNVSLTGQGEPRRVRHALVTAGFFPMFGARAAMGRLLQPADSQHENTAVLSHGAWQRVFGADSSVIGRALRIDDALVTVVGVLDPNFPLPDAIVDAPVDLWRPVDPTAEYMTKRDYWMFNVAGRLRVEATMVQAQQEAAHVANERARAFPRYIEDGRVIPLPVRTLRDATTGAVEQPLRLLLGAVSLLLLVACANVTHLVLARGVGRSREMAVRRALGARTRSLVAQLLLDSVVLGAAGAALGAAIAHAGVRAFLALTPAGLPRAATIAVDARVLLFAGSVGMLTAIVFGLLPALRLARGASAETLRDSGRTLTGSRGAHRLRRALVVGEVAVSLVLVAQAGWLLRSFIRMSNADHGFRTSGILEIPLSIPQPAQANSDGAAEWHRRLDAIREELAQTRGVQSVAFGLTMPLEYVDGGNCCYFARPTFVGKERPTRTSVIHPVSEDFFDVFAIGFVAGEGWTRATATGAPYPAVINEQLANQVYGGAGAALGATGVLDQREFQIVGVARNTRHYGVDKAYGTAVYIPANTMPFAPGTGTMVALTTRTDDALAGELRAAIWRAEPNLPVPTITTVLELARQDSADRRFDTVLFATFSVVALLLVAGGLAGTLLYMVSLQRRSLGIQLALGATPRGIERGVLTRGVRLAAIGVIIGTIGAWFAGRLIESRLYGVEARDAGTLGLAVSVLMLIALLASWIPARRAAMTNPIESLRAE